MLKIHYISDIHFDNWLSAGHRLEFDFETEISKDTTNVFLILGDCINGLFRHSKFRIEAHKLVRDFVTGLSNYGRVIFVLGNHEFYKLTMGDALEEWKEHLEDIPNLQVVENISLIELEDGTAIIAGTNWPQMNAQDYVTGYSDIGAMVILTDDGIQPATCSDMANLGLRTEKEWLEFENFDFSKYKRIIVATHFATMPTRNAYKIYPVPAPYFNYHCPPEVIENIVSYAPTIPVYFIFGHTHINEEYSPFEGVNVTTNQIGYAREGGKFSFKFLLGEEQ